MRYEQIRIILFWTMACTVPSLVFLIQVVMLMPANVLAAYLLLGIGEAMGGQANSELFFFAVVFAVPFLISLAIFAGLSTLIAKLIALLKAPAPRNVLTALLVIGLWSAALLPIYGSGGHGPMKWVNMLGVVEEFGRYGWWYVYGPTVLLGAIHLWYRSRRLFRTN